MSDVTLYEDFEPGRVFGHHWGRTLTEGDAMLWATMTHLYEPRYLNAETAAELGHERLPVSPYLVLGVAIGLSVEDLSESGGPFLGADDVTFAAPVHVGDTLDAASRVVSRRPSRRPGWGVVQWETVGVVDGREVIRFRRTSLVRRRDED